MLMSFWSKISYFLDQTAMYRVVTIALLTLVLSAYILSFLDLLPYSISELTVSLLVAVAVAFLLNILLAKLWRIPANHESALITALILFFIVIPAENGDLSKQLIIALAVALAIFSKFTLTFKKQHLVNPAAFGVLALSIIYSTFPIEGFFESMWWIGNPVMFLPLLIVGFLLVKKIRRFALVMSFIVISFVIFLFEGWRFGTDLSTEAIRYFLSGPSLFLAFFMLTEPFTTPPTKKLQMYYGGTVGFISATTVFSPWITMTPELALVIGNLLFYPTTLRQKLFLKLKSFSEIADHTYEFVFEKPKNFSFRAGQYLEWMLPHDNSDNRGIRRYFTIASSPTEPEIRLAMRMTESGSSYKKEILKLEASDMVIASQLAGDFLLPKNGEVKLGFIAGGIGITPFRSHLKYMTDKKIDHDTVLFYANNTRQEIAYRDLFDELEKQSNFKSVYILTKEQPEGDFEFGFIDEAMLKRRAPDFLDRHWYISGPPGMVNAYVKLLKKLGVPNRQIKQDYFPGLA